MAIISGQTAASVTKTVLVDATGKVYTVPGTSETYLVLGTLTTVPTNTLSTVLDFTNSGTDIKCSRILGSGTANAEWFIYINDILKIIQRTTAAEMSLNLAMDSFILANTDNIKVKLKHYRTSTQDFECTLNYGR